ncbi:MAG: ATP-binding protein [bacterium]
MFDPNEINNTSPGAQPYIRPEDQVKVTLEQKKQLERNESSNTKEVLEEELIYRRGIVSVRDLISPSSLEITSSYIHLDDKYVRTLFIVEYPRYISVGWFAPIINMDITADMSFFFYPVKAPVILKQLKKKVGNVEADLISRAEKGAPRDPLLETALRDMEKLRDDLTQGIEHFFQTGLYITVYAKSIEDLDRNCDRVENFFGSTLIYSKRVFYQAEQGFNSTLPLAFDELQILINVNTSPAASSFPFVSSDLTSDRGILYGINRHNNSLILFDRFSMQNANMVVFATSGAGKSYIIKLEVLRSLMLGVDVIIIDPEREYKHLCDAVGGTYIDISLNSESKINPFDLPRAMGEDAKPADIIRSAVITVKGLIRLMIGNVTYEEDSIIDRALLETYAKKDITPDVDLTKIEPPILSDFQTILEGMEGAENIALRLKKYTEGTFAGLINSPTNVEMANQLVIFSVRDLEDELKPIAIYTIVNYIWNVVRSEMKKRIMIIDEAWWLMQREDSAKFIFALVKRCRKYFLGVTTITQDVNDFLTSPYGQAIVNNSAMQVLLKQTPAAVGLVQKTFMLTEGEKYLLLESSVGEGIFFAGSKHAAIKVVASYSEDQLITSDPRQLLEIEQAKKEFAESMKNEAEEQPEEEAEKSEEEKTDETKTETPAEAEKQTVAKT